jgi:hypothetical protein
VAGCQGRPPWRPAPRAPRTSARAGVHEGDVGEGGGLLRAGDCLKFSREADGHMEDANYEEAGSYPPVLCLRRV